MLLTKLFAISAFPVPFFSRTSRTSNASTFGYWFQRRIFFGYQTRKSLTNSFHFFQYRVNQTWRKVCKRRFRPRFHFVLCIHDFSSNWIIKYERIKKLSDTFLPNIFIYPSHRLLLKKNSNATKYFYKSVTKFYFSDFQLNFSAAYFEYLSVSIHVDFDEVYLCSNLHPASPEYVWLNSLSVSRTSTISREFFVKG